jgi:dihydrodipicolinate synthase/N-acetylneuraminate lyase
VHPPNNGLSPIDELVPPMRFRRPIVGMSAVLLPHLTDGSVDWDGLAGQLGKAFESGLRPAVNMDTGFVQLLDDATRRRVLALTADVAQGRPFVAGAFVADAPGAPFDADRLARAAAAVSAAGGVPVVFPSWGLHTLSDHAWVDALAGLG